ncbi:MAG TPA: penicillin acylase family protein, partial [Caldilineaceae bacterium]|nr:penicillin acylase family protein [Caldilineaceae bacterium]
MLLNLVIVLAVVLGLAALIVGGFLLYIYWWLVQRPTPKLDGTFVLDCLEQPVEVRRDKHGIPHVYAQNRADLLRAQGFLHAQDRLWQMEQNRRIARGTLAEVFGESALEADRFSRIIGFRRAAKAELAVLEADARQLLTWYCQGVNAYIEQHQGKLAAEFNLLRVTPEPWQPEDILAHSKVMAWGLGINWESELVRLRLLQRLGPIRAADLEPDFPKQNPVIMEAVGSETVTRLLSTAGLLLNEYEKVKQWIGPAGDGQGSNSWAIAPKHSMTRRAILCNDPHLALQMPGVWYENHLECPDFRVSGASFAGVPGVVIGHNEHIAWGFTNACVDVQDLYLERAHPEDPTRFEYQGQWEPATVIEETIQVRRGQPHVERVVVTRHGPLISNLVPEAANAPPLALRWTGHEPGRILSALLLLNQARNWEEFQAALEGWSAPAQNITYADADGNIGYVLAGAIPLRRQNLGLVPAPGWDGAHEWAGMIPPRELPRLYNPPSGKIVTANQKITGDDYHHFLGAEFLPGWRAARLEEMLSEKERFSLRDMEEMQLDTVSKFAAALAPWFAQLDSDDPWVTVALGYLRRWNYRMDADSTPALIFQYATLY